MAQRKQRETGPESDSGARESTARTLRHPLRVQILAACHQRDLTPKEFARGRRMSVAAVSYHFRSLEKAGYLQVAREEMVRGARRYFYRAKGPGLVEAEKSALTGSEVDPAASTAVLQGFIVRCLKAIREGTLDARPDSHLTWSPMQLDQQAWNELMGELDQLFKRSHEIQAEAQDRLRTSDEALIPVTLGLAGFESPADDP
jgi:DNA-binding transcriptional ArsR family regulator